MPDGNVTSLLSAMQRKPEDSVIFSWVKWASKEARDAGCARIMDDPRMKPAANPMPFDGQRLIYGGLAPIVEG